LLWRRVPHRPPLPPRPLAVWSYMSKCSARCYRAPRFGCYSLIRVGSTRGSHEIEETAPAVTPYPCPWCGGEAGTPAPSSVLNEGRKWRANGSPVTASSKGRVRGKSRPRSEPHAKAGGSRPDSAQRACERAAALDAKERLRLRVEARMTRVAARVSVAHPPIGISPAVGSNGGGTGKTRWSTISSSDSGTGFEK